MTLADRQLAALADVGALLDSRGLPHWLFGGWAVDFHLGAVTRAHGDVDLAVRLDDAEAIRAAFEEAGWRHAPTEDEDGGTGFERNGVRVELTYLTIEAGGGVSIALRAGDIRWSPTPLGDATLELNGVRARAIPLALLRDGKSRPREDPAEAEVDRVDFDALSRLAP